MIAIGRWLRNGLLTLALGAAACSPVYTNHGYVPGDEYLDELTVGVDTRDTVSDFIGRPAASGVMEDSGWYYVGSRWKEGGLKPSEELERQVVAISFDEQGVVTNIERFGLEDGQVVALSRRVTAGGTKIGFLRQLLGNIGNFTANQILDRS